MRLSVRFLEHIRPRLPIYGCSKGTRHASQESSIHGNLLVFRHDLFHGVRITPYGKGTYDLSEMFIVRQKYMNQLQDNYVRQGRGNIGQGSLSHTFMNAFNQVGIVPEEVYSGINYDSDRHNHAEMVKYIKQSQRPPWI